MSNNENAVNNIQEGKDWLVESVEAISDFKSFEFIGKTFLFQENQVNSSKNLETEWSELYKIKNTKRTESYKKIKKMMKKNFLENLRTKIHSTINMRIDSLTNYHKFMSVYPISFKSINLDFEKLVSGRWAVDPQLKPKFFLTDPKLFLKVESFKVDEQTLANQREQMKSASQVSLALVFQIVVKFLIKKEGYLEVYLECFEEIVPFFVFSELIERLSIRFRIEKEKKRAFALNSSQEIKRSLEDVCFDVD